MKKIICVDLDGTISDARDRLHLIRNKPKRWNQFFKESINDPVYPIVLEKIENHFTNGDIIILTTARPESNRQITLNWLELHDINYHELIMRNHNDFRKDYIVKSEMVDHIIEKYHKLPDLAYDDNDDVLHMFNNRKISTIDAKNYNEGE